MKTSEIIVLRKKLNLTQSELAERAGLSIRTVQRIEAGVIPSGYTLDALCKVLGVSKEKLLNIDKEDKVENWKLIKYINLSSLVLILIPLGNIFIPLVIMFWKREFNRTTKEIVSLQILWTISSLFVIILTAIINRWFELGTHLMAITVVLLIAINFFIVLKNTKGIDKNKTLLIRPRINFF